MKTFGVPQTVEISTTKWLMQGVITVIISIVLAIIGSYMATINNAIPRADAEKLVSESEARSNTAIKDLNLKQDQIMDKLNNIEVKEGILLDRMDKKGSGK